MFAMFTRFGQFMGMFATSSEAEGATVELNQQPHTWYDKVLYIMMRLVRPLVVFGFFFMLYLAWFHPADFKTFGGALKELPEFVAFSFMAVLLSVTVPKMIQSSRAPTTSVKTEVVVETTPKVPDSQIDTANAPNPTLDAIRKRLGK